MPSILPTSVGSRSLIKSLCPFIDSKDPIPLVLMSIKVALVSSTILESSPFQNSFSSLLFMRGFASPLTKAVIMSRYLLRVVTKIFQDSHDL